MAKSSNQKMKMSFKENDVKPDVEKMEVECVRILINKS